MHKIDHSKSKLDQALGINSDVVFSKIQEIVSDRIPIEDILNDELNETEYAPNISKSEFVEALVDKISKIEMAYLLAISGKLAAIINGYWKYTSLNYWKSKSIEERNLQNCLPGLYMYNVFTKENQEELMENFLKNLGTEEIYLEYEGKWEKTQKDIFKSILENKKDSDKDLTDEELNIIHDALIKVAEELLEALLLSLNIYIVSAIIDKCFKIGRAHV